MPRTAKDLVTEAKQNVENLNVDDVAREIARGDIVLVDLREPEERAQHGAIPGSVAAPRGMFEFYADPATPYHKKELDPTRRIILHCASGGRSALAASTLRDMGFDNVAHLDGGFTAWKAAGQPTTAPASASQHP